MQSSTFIITHMLHFTVHYQSNVPPYKNITMMHLSFPSYLCLLFSWAFRGSQMEPALTQVKAKCLVCVRNCKVWKSLGRIAVSPWTARAGEDENDSSRHLLLTQILITVLKNIFFKKSRFLNKNKRHFYPMLGMKSQNLQQSVCTFRFLALDLLSG